MMPRQLPVSDMPLSAGQSLSLTESDSLQSIDEMLESWQEERTPALLLKKVLKFADECQEHKGQELVRHFQNHTQNPVHTIRTLCKYYHPDKHNNLYPDLMPGQRKMLVEMFTLLQVVNERIRRNQYNLPPEKASRASLERPRNIYKNTEYKVDDNQSVAESMRGNKEIQIESDEFREALRAIYAMSHKNENMELAERQADSHEKEISYVESEYEINKKNLQRVFEFEKNCFLSICAVSSNISTNTFKSLLRIYGRIISLTIHLAIDYDPDFLMENMRWLENHLLHVRPYLDETGLTEEFEKSLNFSFKVSADQLGFLNQLRDILENSSLEAKENNEKEMLGKKVSAAVGFGITTAFSIAISIGTFGAALPFLAVGLSLALGGAIGEVTSADNKQKAIDKVRAAYFDAFFQGIIAQLEGLNPAIKEEIAYYQALRRNQKISSELDCLLHAEFNKYLETFRSLYPFPNADLQMFEKIYDKLNKRLNRSGLSDEEKQQLQKLGYTYNVCEEEAAYLREQLAFNLSEAELRLRYKPTQSFLEDHSNVASPRPMMQQIMDEKQAENENLNDSRPTHNGAARSQSPIFAVSPESAIDQSASFFTPEEQRELESLGMVCEGISPEEANFLRDLLAMQFSEAEKAIIRVTPESRVNQQIALAKFSDNFSDLPSMSFLSKPSSGRAAFPSANNNSSITSNKLTQSRPSTSSNHRRNGSSG